MEHKLYFAYGSNINLDQMAYRCPNAVVTGPVVLEDYELLFRGNSGGSGVATIAPKKGSVVYGLLWSITPACERPLDKYEDKPFPQKWTQNVEKKRNDSVPVRHPIQAAEAHSLASKCAGEIQPSAE